MSLDNSGNFPPGIPAGKPSGIPVSGRPLKGPEAEEFRPPEELVSLYAEPQQERELAKLLREAVLSGRSLIADCSRTHRGIRITFGLISARQVKKIRKILTEEAQSSGAASMSFYPLQNAPENAPEKS